MVLKWCEKHRQWYYQEDGSEKSYIEKLLSEPKKETAASRKLREGKSVTEIFGGVY